MIEAYNNGSKDIAVKNMESLLLLCDGTKFEYEPGKAYVSGNSKKLVLNDLVLSKATSYHEFGHLIHNVLASQYLPSNFNSILERAKLSCKNNVFKLEEMQRENQKLYSAYSTLGNLKFEGYVRDNYGSMINFKDIIKQNVTQELNIKGIEGILQEVGIYDEEIIESIKDTIYKNGEQFGIEMLSKTIINKKRNIFCEKEERKYWGPAIDDIISAIYKNQEVKIESGGNNIIRYRHETQYWNTTSDGLLSMCELMANYNQLKLSGNLEQISWLRDIFGDELFDLLENTYNRAFS